MSSTSFSAFDTIKDELPPLPELDFHLLQISGLMSQDKDTIDILLRPGGGKESLS